MSIVDVHKPEFWDDLYNTQNTNWDLKSSNPVFVDILKKNKILKGGALLIPGCGKGYNAIAAAKFGFKVTALDFSSKAIDFAIELAKNEPVKVNFLVADFFKLGSKYANYFDSVYDYTTYCAINPESHDEYAKMISSVMKPGGIFLAILFPVEKRNGGPPFGIDAEECLKVFSKYLKLQYQSNDLPSIKPRKGREVIQVYTK